MANYEMHPVYGYLTAQEYEEAKNAGAGMAKYYKELHEKRKKEAKKARNK